MTIRNASTIPLLFGLLVAVPCVAAAQEGPFKVEALAEAPPADAAGPIKEVLNAEGIRVLDAQGKPYVDLWLRKGTPAKAKPGAPEGAVQLPFLEVGELLGLVRFHSEGFDYRDQTIEAGVYTIRYGLQPVNGDHLGVSTFRDYGMLLRAADDKALAPVPQQRLDKESAGASGTNHPAIFILLAAPAGQAGPGVVRDEMEDRWGVILPLGLAVAGGEAATLPVQMVFLGHGPI